MHRDGISRFDVPINLLQLTKRFIMQKLSYLLVALLGVSMLFLTSCEKDPDPVNEEEVITTLTMTWTPDGGGTPIVFQFRDVDGEGGMDPVLTTAPLAANTTYNVSLELLNETEDPAEDITEEVEEEGAEHQFFFAVTQGINLTFSYLDTDTNGAPIGLETQMNTGDASTGALQVTLRHEPDKGAAGVAQGDITNAGGETDIQVEFDLVIQ